MKRTIVLALAITGALNAASMSLTVPAHKPHGWRNFWIGTLSSLEVANAADYATTRAGAFPGRAGCEQNPLFSSGICGINVSRFTGVKIGIAGMGILELLSLRHPTSVKYAVWSAVNTGLAIPLAVGDLHNLGQLGK